MTMKKKNNCFLPTETRNNDSKTTVIQNSTFENRTFHISRHRRTIDGKTEVSRDRRKMVVKDIFLKPYDRRQNNDPNDTNSERRSPFDRRSIFDRREHYELWLKAKKQHKNRTQEIAQYRLESLKTSHSARISLLEEQLNNADDERIKRMRKTQINSAQADYSRRIQDLEIASERADITFKPVAFGEIEVVGEK